MKDPWGQPYQIGADTRPDGTMAYFVYTTHPDTGKAIRSDTRD